jgi:hypothetical protein
MSRESEAAEASWFKARRHPSGYTPHQLRRILLDDHVRHREENPAWVGAAIIRIAQRERKGVEALCQELGQETQQATGVSMFSPVLTNPMRFGA